MVKGYTQKSRMARVFKRGEPELRFDWALVASTLVLYSAFVATLLWVLFR